MSTAAGEPSVVPSPDAGFPEAPMPLVPRYSPFDNLQGQAVAIVVTAFG